MNNELKNIIEALLMVSDVPVGVSKIQGLFEEGSAPEAAEIKEAIEALNKDCEPRSIEVKKIGSGYRFQTKSQYAEWIRKLQAGRPPKLSRAQLETLAIIAYRQPVSRGDIEEIRGVAVSGEIMQRLMEREWIKQVGVRDVPGRPGLFGTTPEFLSYFSLESLGELPPLMEQRDFGDIARDMDIQLPPEVLFALQGEEAEVQSDMFVEKEDEENDGKEQDAEEQAADDSSESEDSDAIEVDAVEANAVEVNEQAQRNESTEQGEIDQIDVGQTSPPEYAEVEETNSVANGDENISEIHDQLDDELGVHADAGLADAGLSDQKEVTAILETDVEKTG